MTSTDYTRDLAGFLRDLYPVEGGYGPRATVPPFLLRWLSAAFPAPDGHPMARNVLDSRSKKQGKSATAGAVACYMAARQPYAEVVIAAADRDQAKDRVLRSVKYAIENGPLAKHAKVYKDVIEWDNRSTITALPQDWRGAAGGNYAAVIFDELHVYSLEAYRRTWDELVIPSTQPHGVRWVASYAGFEGESTLLKELWDRALAGERIDDDLPIYHAADSSLLALIDTGPESWRMPWTTGEAGQRFMAQVQANERPTTFRRLYLNEWVSGTEAFITAEQFDRCVDPALLPMSPNHDIPLFVGVDLASRGDDCAVVALAPNGPRRARVAWHKVWHTSKKNELNLNDVADFLRAKHREYWLSGIWFDPSQARAIAQQLAGEGLRMREVPQSQSELGPAGLAVWEAFRDARLTFYPAPELRQAALNAAAKEIPAGLHLTKATARNKVDAIVALSFVIVPALGASNTRPDATATANAGASMPSRWRGEQSDEMAYSRLQRTSAMKAKFVRRRFGGLR